MHWYLLYTHSWHEKKVKKHLERERFETFLPVTERWSRRKDRRERITLPLFPGYLFVRTEMNAEIYLKILKIKGVIEFFCNGGKPAIIPDKEMENIQRDFRKSHKSLITPIIELNDYTDRNLLKKKENLCNLFLKSA